MGPGLTTPTKSGGMVASAFHAFNIIRIKVLVISCVWSFKGFLKKLFNKGIFIKAMESFPVIHDADVPF